MHATHADVRTLECPVKHGPDRLKWLCKVRMAMEWMGRYTGGWKEAVWKAFKKDGGGGGAEWRGTFGESCWELLGGSSWRNTSIKELSNSWNWCDLREGIDQSGSIFIAESWDFKNVVKLHSRIWYVTYLIKFQPVAPVKDSAVSLKNRMIWIISSHQHLQELFEIPVSRCTTGFCRAAKWWRCTFRMWSWGGVIGTKVSFSWFACKGWL